MLTPSDTSYFSRPAAGLDPRLFTNGKLRGETRSAILQLLFNHLNRLYTGADAWAHVWLAGSGVSYQWAANRDPGDLDCLIGIDFPKFRKSNINYAGFSDKEIATTLNEGFRAELQPQTEMFMGTYELTFYVNPQSDIVKIKPYAAYSVTDDDWTVVPSFAAAEVNPAWEKLVEQDRLTGIDIITRYISAKTRFETATNQALKANARSDMRVALSQAVALYDTIHESRSNAFGPSGEGYSDFDNYRWQAGKRTGLIPGLRSIKKTLDDELAQTTQKTYGVELPDANTLVRRAATYRR